MKNSVAWVSAFSLICAALAYAGVPQTINYQGYLTTAGGTPATGPVSMIFSLYSSNPARNNPVWREIKSVSTINGTYSVQLGSEVPINAPFDVPYYLGISVGNEPEMLPLHPLTSTGYAFRAKAAESIISTGNISIQSSGQSVLRIETNAASPNITLGSQNNIAGGSGTYGATVTGGGQTGTTCYESTTGISSRACSNNATKSYATVGGGRSNHSEGTNSTIAGGESNTASGNYSTIGGGYSNTASGNYSSISGGYNNIASNENSTVAGGFFNTASGGSSVVIGGISNFAIGGSSAVVAGGHNTAAGESSIVVGSSSSSASGAVSIVAGGYMNLAGGDYSFAAGNQAKVRDAAMAGNSTGDQGTFVWADSQNTGFTSTGNNQFLIRAQNGVGINTNNPVAALDVRGNATVSGTLNLPVNGLAVATNQLVAAGGNVGIGTANPSFKLDVENTFNTDAKFGDVMPIYLVHSLPSVGFNAYYNNGWKLGKGSVAKYGGILDLDFTGNFRFQTSNTAGNSDTVITPKELVRIQPDGNVGIGTSSPKRLLHLSRAGATELSLEVSDGAANNKVWNFAAYGSPTTASQLDIRVLNDSGSAVTKNVLTLKNDGSVGIGGALIFSDGTRQTAAKTDCMGRYEDNGDGTVTDCRSGLIWLKNANCTDAAGGVAYSTSGVRNFTEMINWTAGLSHGICGLSDGSVPGDWRPPTRTEWMAMVASAKRLAFANPSITNRAGTAKWSNGDLFLNIYSGGYWSLNNYSGLRSNNDWVIDLFGGSLQQGVPDSYYHVWPVRNGNLYY